MLSVKTHKEMRKAGRKAKQRCGFDGCMALAWSHGERLSMNGISGVLHFKAKGSSFSIPLLSLAMVHSWAGEGGVWVSFQVFVDKGAPINWGQISGEKDSCELFVDDWQQLEGRMQWPVKESE